MRQSMGDLVRVVPLAGLFVVFGLELSTVAILRYMPSLLPRAMRTEVVPAAQRLGVAPASDADKAARKRLTLCTDLVQASRATAKASGLADAEALLARVEEGIGHRKVSAIDIRAAAKEFDGTELELDALPKAVVEQLAELHLPSAVTVPGPERVGDLVGTLASTLTPTLLLRRRLRDYVRAKREDDKEILVRRGVSTTLEKQPL